MRRVVRDSNVAARLVRVGYLEPVDNQRSFHCRHRGAPLAQASRPLLPAEHKPTPSPPSASPSPAPPARSSPDSESPPAAGECQRNDQFEVPGADQPVRHAAVADDETAAWNFLGATLTTLGGGDPTPVLTDVLRYHVPGQRVTAFDLILRSIFRIDLSTLLTDATITQHFFSLRDNTPDLRDPRRPSRRRMTRLSRTPPTPVSSELARSDSMDTAAQGEVAYSRKRT